MAAFLLALESLPRNTREKNGILKYCDYWRYFRCYSMLIVIVGAWLRDRSICDETKGGKTHIKTPRERKVLVWGPVVGTE